MKTRLFTKKQPIGAIILAGGKSKRFGSDKTLVNFQGAPLVQRVVNVVKKITNDIIIVTNSPEKYAFLPHPKTYDLISDRGPLGGIYSGLFYSLHEKNIVVASDMPFITVDCINYLITHSNNNNADVVVPIYNGKYEPLCAIYSRRCLSKIKEQLDQKNNQVFAFYDKVNTIEVNFNNDLDFDTQHIFHNINSVRDMTLYGSIDG